MLERGTMGELIDIFRQELSSTFVTGDWQVALTRLCLACFFGAIIGFEREWKGKAAGMRTHIIVSMAACLFTLVAFEIVQTAEVGAATGALRLDPLRLIEGVTAGVAFLGAGTIIVSTKKVHGLTTAAGMWLSGAVGLAVGIGQAGLAVMATALAIIVLEPLKWLEKSLGDDR
ncbi:putative Mg2+ transporter-C (MgtC) family protein [Tropicimonas isoalkanivorans]|uniref:Protein MgtC n=2 Tax=Tropicimonas isoalkanivorans TaxID=441112 RepID=A0A1I1NKQ1_9RHOB|nr:putative Mg2+ transporter-C (MgtC) family protein [Tropicimonas isoalkanivorans]